MQEYKVIEEGKCIICDEDSQNKLLCFNCWQEQKAVNKINEHYCDQDVKNHYFNQKDAISRIWNLNYVENAIFILASLAFELEYVYNDSYLVERLAKDIDQIRNYKFKESKEKQKETDKKQQPSFDDKDFRQINPPQKQAKDGHYVRSKAEMLIDNWLFDNEYLHIYEKRVPIDTNLDAVVICDFYLPKQNIYIEYWGIEDSKEYEERKAKKIKMYDDNNLLRLDLYDKDIDRLEDILRVKIQKLLK